MISSLKKINCFVILFFVLVKKNFVLKYHDGNRFKKIMKKRGINLKKRSISLKKYNIACIAGILGCMVLISGCGRDLAKEIGNTNVPTAESEASDANKAIQGDDTHTPAEQPVLSAKDYVKDAYSIKCTLEEGTEYEYDIEYHVPEITFDCEGAEVLNKQILEDCADVKEPESLDDFYGGWETVSYEVYLYQDYLSILLEMKACVGEYYTYTTYNLNTATGQVATTAELAKASGITETEIPDLLYQAAVYEADRITMECLTSEYMKNEEDSTFKQDVYLDNINARFRTIDELSKNIDNTNFYLTEEGELSAIIAIETLAGAGISNRPLTVSKKNASNDFDLSFEDGIFISYQDGNMTVRIEENDWSRSAFYNTGLEYGTEYPVKGVLKDYVQGEMMAIMYGDFAIPVFVSDDQTIAFMNIYECAQSGTFCLTEMAYVPEPIEALTKDNEQFIDQSLSHCIFEQYDGYSKRMMNLYELEGGMAEYEMVDEDGSVKTAYRYIGFDMDDPGQFIYQESDFEGNFNHYKGYATYMGMDENGLYFSYLVDNSDFTLSKHGMFQTKRTTEWDENWENCIIALVYTYISGDNLFPEEEDTVNLDITMG